MSSPAAAIPAPTSKVELRFQCKGLTNKDTFSKSDPQLFVYQKVGQTQKTLVGKTEQIDNNLNPTFKTPVFVDYYFEVSQYLTFVVYDIDDGVFDVNNDFIGDTECSLASIIASPGSTFTAMLKSKSGHHAGNITVTAELVSQSKQRLSFQICGHHLDKKDFFGKSDPYFTVSKANPNGYAEVFKSEIHFKTLDPVFRAPDLCLDQLTGGDLKRELLFNFYDYDKIGKHDYIGCFTTNVEQLLSSSKVEFQLINQKKKDKKSSYKNSGVIDIERAYLYRPPLFTDYLVGGCEISLVVGIDCTASNYEPKVPKSLHYNNPEKLNPYAEAIYSIGNVLAPYDSDGNIPVYGFGAILPGMSQVNHCFAMTLNDSYPEVRGVDGIMNVYYQNITAVKFSGPTSFSPLIRHATHLSSGTSQANQKYTILLIITDGEIMDMEATIDAIINATNYPLSIVIVGVGNADFSSMIRLDGDDHALTNGMNTASRDIVQFVAHSEYKNKPFHMLAEETLREIPSQFMEYMGKYGIKPNPPRVYVPQPSMEAVQQQFVNVQINPVADQPVSLEKPVNLEKQPTPPTASPPASPPIDAQPVANPPSDAQPAYPAVTSAEPTTIDPSTTIPDSHSSVQ